MDHFEKYPVDLLKKYKYEITKQVGRLMDLRVVFYTHQFEPAYIPYLDVCDVITMWTWWGKDIPALGENFSKMKDMIKTGKRLVAGCYMWDYGSAKPIPDELMHYQLEKYNEWLDKGEIEGIIFCSNCIADIGIEAVEITRRWIAEVGDDTI